MLRQPVRGAVDGHRAHAKLGGCAEDADGDLAAVRSQELLEPAACGWVAAQRKQLRVGAARRDAVGGGCARVTARSGGSKALQTGQHRGAKLGKRTRAKIKRTLSLENLFKRRKAVFCRRGVIDGCTRLHCGPSLRSDDQRRTRATQTRRPPRTSGRQHRRAAKQGARHAASRLRRRARRGRGSRGRRRQGLHEALHGWGGGLRSGQGRLRASTRARCRRLRRYALGLVPVCNPALRGAYRGLAGAPMASTEPEGAHHASRERPQGG